MRAWHWGIAVLGFVSLAACSDDSRTEGAGGEASSNAVAGSAGTAASGGATGGAGTMDKQCRTGTPTEGAALMREHAGSYTFPGRESPCVFRGETFVSSSTYRVVVEAEPPSVTVFGGNQAQLFAAAWTEGRDLACTGEYAEYFELGNGADSVRVSFLNGDPSGVVLGTCVFLLN